MGRCKYVFNPVGHKSRALWRGLHELPASANYILHLDDDTVLPKGMVFDESHFADDNRVSAVGYGISMFRAGDCEKCVDFEFLLWSHWRQFRSIYSVDWFLHGIVGLWRRERFHEAMRQHPYLPFGEDGWLGIINLCRGHL